jgi:hypothetical protein
MTCGLWNPFVNLIELLLTVTDELESHGVVYALTGSIASSLYGQPLPSLDADLALRMTPAQARDVSRSLSSRFYVSEEALVDAAARGTMANVIDGSSGFKIDLSVLPHTPFMTKSCAAGSTWPWPINPPRRSGSAPRKMCSS